MDQNVQLRAKIKGIIAEGRIRPGSVFWTTVERASGPNGYIEQDIAELIGPAETKPAGPGHAKPAPPVEKKTPSPSSPDATAGPLSGSAALTAPGRVTAPASSGEGKASPGRRSKRRGTSAGGLLL